MELLEECETCKRYHLYPRCFKKEEIPIICPTDVCPFHEEETDDNKLTMRLFTKELNKTKN